ncbi:MAG: hypothetical protein AAF733_08265 [Verrucomicrobiota bacterium]
MKIARNWEMCFATSVENEPEDKPNRFAMGLATGWIILRHRPYRRNLLFFTTLATLILVFVGAVPLGRLLATSVKWFAAFWIVVFLLAAFVLLLAIYDLIRIRKDHRKRMSSLEKELAEATEEARRLAREELESDRESD